MVQDEVTPEVILLEELCVRVKAAAVRSHDWQYHWQEAISDALNEVMPGDKYDHYAEPIAGWNVSLPEHIRIAAAQGVPVGSIIWIVSQHLPPDPATENE